MLLGSYHTLQEMLKLCCNTEPVGWRCTEAEAHFFLALKLPLQMWFHSTDLLGLKCFVWLWYSGIGLWPHTFRLGLMNSFHKGIIVVLSVTNNFWNILPKFTTLILVKPQFYLDNVLRLSGAGLSISLLHLLPFFTINENRKISNKRKYSF